MTIEQAKQKRLTAQVEEARLWAEYRRIEKEPRVDPVKEANDAWYAKRQEVEALTAAIAVMEASE